MITESQIAADMASAYQQQATFEYMLAREIRDRGFAETTCALQRKAAYYAWRSRRYREWIGK